MPDYNQKLYNFIYNRICNLKHMPAMFNAAMFKKMAEEHYGYEEVDAEEWEFAYTWATANVFGDGCEAEVY